MFCSQCGADNIAGAKFCAKCGTALALAAPPPPVQEVTTMRGMQSAAVPGALTTTPAVAGSVSPTGKTPWVAVPLSFFISGLGQVYNNDWKKGAVMFVGAILGLLFTGGLATIVIWIWGLFDAYQVASGKGKVW